jgi:hypothetical protein
MDFKDLLAGYGKNDPKQEQKKQSQQSQPRAPYEHPLLPKLTDIWY